MGDYYSKINAVEQSAKNFLIGLFKRAKEQGMTSSDINELYLAYRKQIKIEKYPRYVSSYITGVHDSLQSIAHNDDLEFCYVVKGKRYSVHKDSPLYYESHGFSPKEIYDLAEQCGHFWKESGKPYYVDKHEKV
jgi:hypothetical protein